MNDERAPENSEPTWAGLFGAAPDFPTGRLSEDIALVDALTDFLYDECDMGGASAYHTKRVLDFIENWRP